MLRLIHTVVHCETNQLAVGLLQDFILFRPPREAKTANEALDLPRYDIAHN